MRFQIISSLFAYLLLIVDIVLLTLGLMQYGKIYAFNFLFLSLMIFLLLFSTINSYVLKKQINKMYRKPEYYYIYVLFPFLTVFNKKITYKSYKFEFPGLSRWSIILYPLVTSLFFNQIFSIISFIMGFHHANSGVGGSKTNGDGLQSVVSLWSAIYGFFLVFLPLLIWLIFFNKLVLDKYKSKYGEEINSRKKLSIYLFPYFYITNYTTPLHLKDESIIK